MSSPLETLASVILPVFVVVGIGYLAAISRLITETGFDQLMKFATNFAIPCLLFGAISTIDISASFGIAMLGTFYGAASLGFVAGMLGARFLFARDWEDAVAIGFCTLYGNVMLVGLPITERAYGADALAANFAIIAVHSPFCYVVGITTMEMVRARGQMDRRVPLKVLRAIASNALIIGIVLGFGVNLTGLALPGALSAGLDLIARAGLPAALFGLGGVLVQYRPEGDLRIIAFVCLLALLVHPLIARGLGGAFGLADPALRSAVITAAMATGVNAYIFANMYGRARRVAASAVLVGTGLSVFSAWFWLGLLP